MQIVHFIVNNYDVLAGITVGIYEVVSRYIPTVKDYSVISNVVKIIDILIPNRKK